MASQRHKREHRFFRKSEPGADPDPRAPEDVAEELASQYGETAAWPNEKRPTDTP